MNLNHLGFTRFTCLTTSWKLMHSEDNDRMKEILTVFRIAEREIKADTEQDNGYPRETVPPKTLENRDIFTCWPVFAL